MARQPKSSPDQGAVPEKVSANASNEKILQVSATYSGPLPPPQALAQYNQIIPDAAERILRMAEKEGEHRHAIEKKLVDSQTAQLKRGSVFSFILGMTTVVGGLVLLYLDKDIGGIGSLVAGVATIVAAFLIVNRKKKN